MTGEAASDIERQVRWLMTLRLVTVTTLLICAFAVELLLRPADTLRPLFTLAAVAYGMVLLYAVLYRGLRDARGFALGQLVGDALVVTFFVAITGGAESPMSFLYLLPITIASLLLYRSGGLCLAGISWTLYASLIVFGLLLAVADRMARNELTLHRDLNLPHALGYGLAQALALIPGVSRSGGTISGGLLLGYRREEAARYSFLLAIPAVLMSGLFELREIGGDQTPAWGPTILATVIAFGVGYAAIAWFLRYISTHRFTPFVVYRVILGILIIGAVSFGLIPAI